MQNRTITDVDAKFRSFKKFLTASLLTEHWMCIASGLKPFGLGAAILERFTNLSRLSPTNPYIDGIKLGGFILAWMETTCRRGSTTDPLLSAKKLDILWPLVKMADAEHYSVQDKKNQYLVSVGGGLC